MQKYNIKKFFIYALCWLCVVGLGTYFRFYPLTLHVDSDSHEQATLLILAQLRSAAAQQVKQAFPQIQGLEKDRLIKENFDRLLRQESKNVKKSIDKLAKKISKNKTGKSTPYLLASDSYYYYGLTRNIVRSGRLGDKIVGSKYLNTLMLAPLGHLEPLNLHPFLGYYLYRFCQFFNPQIDVMYAISFLPLIIAAISLIPFFAMCHVLGYRLWATGIGSVFFFLAPIYLKRSAFGWYDNDPYSILFPLVILLCILTGMSKEGRQKQSLVFACLCAILIACYAFFWQGWVFLFIILLISGVLILSYSAFVLKDKNATYHLGKYLGITFFGTLVGIALFFGIHDFFVLFQEGFDALKNFLKPELALWPNIFISVGELRGLPLKEIIELNGSFFFFAISVYGLLVSVKNLLLSPNKNNALSYIIITTLFVFSFYITLGAQRFALLFLVPLSLLFPLGLQSLYALLGESIPKKYKGFRPSLQLLARSICIVIISVVLLFSLRTAHATMTSWRPIFNKTWEKALLYIKTHTPQESIVNCWWPPGHFITSTAQRRVTFDGATINNPQGYWMAYLLLSTNEKEAVGILRMLNNSANEAVDYIHSQGKALSWSVTKMREIVKLNKKDAHQILKKDGFSKKHINDILALTHKRPPPSYFLMYNELIEKNIEFSFIGKWDFAKIETIRNDPALLKRVLKQNTKERVHFLWDLIGGMPRFSETLSPFNKKGDMVYFEENVRINIKDMTCQITSKKFGQGIPRNIFYLKDDALIKKELKNSNLSYSVLLVREGSAYSCILLDEALAQSMLVRLSLFQGKGLRYFKPFLKEANPTKRTQIYVYEIDWKTFEQDLNSFSR